MVCGDTTSDLVRDCTLSIVVSRGGTKNGGVKRNDLGFEVVREGN